MQAVPHELVIVFRRRLEDNTIFLSHGRCDCKGGVGVEGTCSHVHAVILALFHATSEAVITKISPSRAHCDSSVGIASYLAGRHCRRTAINNESISAVSGRHSNVAGNGVGCALRVHCSTPVGQEALQRIAATADPSCNSFQCPVFECQRYFARANTAAKHMLAKHTQWRVPEGACTFGAKRRGIESLVPCGHDAAMILTTCILDYGEKDMQKRAVNFQRFAEFIEKLARLYKSEIDESCELLPHMAESLAVFEEWRTKLYAVIIAYNLVSNDLFPLIMPKSVQQMFVAVPGRRYSVPQWTPLPCRRAMQASKKPVLQLIIVEQMMRARTIENLRGFMDQLLADLSTKDEEEWQSQSRIYIDYCIRGFQNLADKENLYEYIRYPWRKQGFRCWLMCLEMYQQQFIGIPFTFPGGGTRYQVDHIIPQAYGSNHRLGNLTVLTQEQNQQQGKTGEVEKVKELIFHRGAYWTPWLLQPFVKRFVRDEVRPESGADSVEQGLAVASKEDRESLVDERGKAILKLTLDLLGFSAPPPPSVGMVVEPVAVGDDDDGNDPSLNRLESVVRRLDMLDISTEVIEPVVPESFQAPKTPVVAARVPPSAPPSSAATSVQKAKAAPSELRKTVALDYLNGCKVADLSAKYNYSIRAIYNWINELKAEAIALRDAGVPLGDIVNAWGSRWSEHLIEKLLR